MENDNAILISRSGIMGYHRWIRQHTTNSVAVGGTKPPACTKCSRNYFSIYHEGSAGFSKCGQIGNFMKECKRNKQGGCNGG